MTEIATTVSVISLADGAVRRIRSLQVLPENVGKHLRVYVEPGGCSGMQYGMVFDEPREGDLKSSADGVCVLVDTFSAGYVHGSVLDYSDALAGSGFKITNPQARQSCGCGKSFET
jgi:iron-sulfur cluster assembly protein